MLWTSRYNRTCGLILNPSLLSTSFVSNAQQTDPELHNYIVGCNEPALETPYFALSWIMCWFSHEVEDLEQCARLFDLFLASHPLMPLYAAVTAMQCNRDIILASGADGAVVYASLKTLNALGRVTVDELACRAAQLYGEVPPNRLVKLAKCKMQHSTAAQAFLQGGRWLVPQGSLPRCRDTGWRQGRSLSIEIDHRKRTIIIAVVVAMLAMLVAHHSVKARWEYPHETNE
jgi:Rab-GTPase-TBC domain